MVDVKNNRGGDLFVDDIRGTTLFKKTDESYQFTHVSTNRNKYRGCILSNVFPLLEPIFWQSHEKFTSVLVDQTPIINYKKMYTNNIFGWVAKLKYEQVIVFNTQTGRKRVVLYNIYLFPQSRKQEPIVTHCIKWI